MEVFGPHNTSASLDINSIGGSSTDPDHLTRHIVKDLSMNDLKKCLTDLFDVEDIRSSTHQLSLSTGKDNVVNDVKECECQVLETDAKGKSAYEKSLSKCTTFPPYSGSKSSINPLIGEKQEEEVSTEVSNGSDKPSDKRYSRSISLPVHLKPAIRGSREKQGIPIKNLSVTWAPDVYDPVPTSTSHVPSNKNQNYRSNSKKSGRHKQKSASKSSRGSKGKDKDKSKKQVRRSGGGTRLKPFYEDSGTSFGAVDVVDFDVGTPDPFCGGSYRTKSITNLHFSVAEAT